MTSRDLTPDDGPELLPPAELLRLRAALARPPAEAVRAQHLAATTMAARQRGHRAMGRFASRGARAAVAIAASLIVTSGLAGAQLLPDQAQRLLSNVSDRFAPESDPPADPAEPGDATTVPDEPARSAPAADAPDGDATTTTEGPAAVLDGPRATTTTLLPSVTTTIPGPAGPGSPDDPTDPDATTTTTTEPPTTTTTQPPTTTTTTTPPSTTTTTTGGGQP